MLEVLGGGTGKWYQLEILAGGTGRRYWLEALARGTGCTGAQGLAGRPFPEAKVTGPVGRSLI